VPKSRSLALVSIVVALVVAWAVGVAAQDGREPAYFTATLGVPRDLAPARMSASDAEHVIRGRGTLPAEQPVEATDPRISGFMTIRNNVDVYQYSGGVVGVNVNSVRIDNDDGAWSGSGTGFFASSAEGDPSVAITVLLGEDAYDGMSVVLDNGTTEEDGRFVEHFRGIIVDGPIAPMPEPVPAE
jgi:hypothetical protein